MDWGRLLALLQYESSKSESVIEAHPSRFVKLLTLFE